MRSWREAIMKRLAVPGSDAAEKVELIRQLQEAGLVLSEATHQDALSVL